jgi:hypothetical protein
LLRLPIWQDITPTVAGAMPASWATLSNRSRLVSVSYENKKLALLPSFVSPPMGAFPR